MISKFVSVMSDLETIKSALIEVFKRKLDSRGDGGENYFNNKAIVDMMDEFVNKLLEKLYDMLVVATNLTLISTFHLLIP